MKNYPIIDLHTDLVLAQRDLGNKLFGFNTKNQISLELAQKAGVKTLFAGFSYDDMKGNTQSMLEESQNMMKENKSGIDIILHLEGAETIKNDPKLLERYQLNGVKSIGLMHSHDNSIAGSNSTNNNKGLTKFGKELVKKVLGLGMIIDLAHASTKTITDTNKITNKSILISHTACRSLVNEPRNTTNEELKLVKETNGLVGIFFSGKYLSNNNHAALSDVADHIEYVANFIGVDYVGIGSDLGGITTELPIGLENVSKLPALFTLLKKRGFTNEDINKIAHQNALRVLKEWGPYGS